jgi:hypothetical protein
MRQGMLWQIPPNWKIQSTLLHLRIVESNADFPCFRDTRSRFFYTVKSCGFSFNTASQLDKHLRNHERPYHCNFPGCTWVKGFTSLTDLERHKKSKHLGYIPSKGWKCKGRNCWNPTKIWPRLDNFKQHIRKMHRDEDLDAVIAASVISVSVPIQG